MLNRRSSSALSRSEEKASGGSNSFLREISQFQNYLQPSPSERKAPKAIRCGSECSSRCRTPRILVKHSGMNTPTKNKTSGSRPPPAPSPVILNKKVQHLERHIDLWRERAGVWSFEKQQMKKELQNAKKIDAKEYYREQLKQWKDKGFLNTVTDTARPPPDIETTPFKKAIELLEWVCSQNPDSEVKFIQSAVKAELENLKPNESIDWQEIVNQQKQQITNLQLEVNKLRNLDESSEIIVETGINLFESPKKISELNETISSLEKELEEAKTKNECLEKTQKENESLKVQLMSSEEKNQELEIKLLETQKQLESRQNLQEIQKVYQENHNLRIQIQNFESKNSENESKVKQCETELESKHYEIMVCKNQNQVLKENCDYYKKTNQEHLQKITELKEKLKFAKKQALKAQNDYLESKHNEFQDLNILDMLPDCSTQKSSRENTQRSHQAASSECFEKENIQNNLELQLIQQRKYFEQEILNLNKLSSPSDFIAFTSCMSSAVEELLLLNKS